MSPIDHDALLVALNAGQVALTHSETKTQLILHGTTEQLRAALGSFGPAEAESQG